MGIFTFTFTFLDLEIFNVSGISVQLVFVQADARVESKAGMDAD
jgi:hypothetical protein